MGLRSELQEILEELLGTKEVYFQPPESVKMNYPAIVFEKSGEDYRFADNIVVSRILKYQITVIHRDPDSNLPKLVSQLPYCRYARPFKSDGLYHDVYEIYY